MPRRSLPAACLAALLLAACAATPPARYYSLPDSAYLPPAGRNGPATAVQIILAAPLDQGGLVYQTDALQLNFARQNLWAAPLEHSLAAAFSNHLNRSGSGLYAPHTRHHGAQVLKIYIEQFQGTYHGHTVVSGYAQWPDGRIRPFDIRTPQQGDGYPAMVESLSQGIGRAADAIRP